MPNVDTPSRSVSVSLSNVCNLSHLESKVKAPAFLFLPMPAILSQTQPPGSCSGHYYSGPGTRCELMDPDRDSVSPGTSGRKLTRETGDVCYHGIEQSSLTHKRGQAAV